MVQFINYYTIKLSTISEVTQLDHLGTKIEDIEGKVMELDKKIEEFKKRLSLLNTLHLDNLQKLHWN